MGVTDRHDVECTFVSNTSADHRFIVFLASHSFGPIQLIQLCSNFVSFFRPHFFSLERALLFWITQSRHIRRISRSPKRGSPEGKEKKTGPSPLSFSHAF